MHELQPVVDYLKNNELILATAESCTAGLIAARLAEVSGSGAVMECGYVVYAVEAKREMLGVSQRTIDEFGLTSEEEEREMALGALKNCGAGIRLANTGQAEAEGELNGTMCFACAMLVEGGPRVVSETIKCLCERNGVREQAACHAWLSVERYVVRLRNPFDKH